MHDVVEYARRENILCQGRGSAANSAVCYALGITEIDPARMQLLFERFISRERNEPPDIDVDFEHERREEVVQYIYRKYGRERAALAATVICYRTRSAVRDVGRALGVAADDLERLTRLHVWWDPPGAIQRRFAADELGIEPARLALLMRLARALIGFPRHLSQHVGGFVISGEPLERPGAGGERRHGGPYRHPVGQGRSGVARAAQGRCARARHADGACTAAST